LVFGDINLPPAAQRSAGFAYYLRLAKTDESSGRELAHVSIQVVGSRPFTLLDCPSKGQVEIGTITGQACFHERNSQRFNTIQSGTSRLIGVEISRALVDTSGIWITIELADISTKPTEVTFSSSDQDEALGIVSSIDLNP
jgi:hypothetical protein